jgi:hypothetical protein
MSFTRALLSLSVLAALVGGCSAPNVTIDVEVRDDEGNLFVADEDIRINCDSNTLSVVNMPLDEASRFQCTTLNEAELMGNDVLINWEVRDLAGRFLAQGDATLLEPGEERSFSIQLERL